MKLRRVPQMPLADDPRRVPGLLEQLDPRSSYLSPLEYADYRKHLVKVLTRRTVTAAWQAHVTIGSLPLYLFGDDTQRERWLRPLAEGRVLGAFGLGGDGLPMQPSESLRAHGKIYFMEEDTLMHNNFDPGGRNQSVENSIAVYQRNFAQALTHGQAVTWFETDELHETPGLVAVQA